jgi:uncharacterized membrane protein
MKMEEQVVIARDIEDLWAFFMDMQNLPSGIAALRASR